MSFVLGRDLFIEPFPMEPELGFVISLAGAVIDAVQIEFPHAAEKRSLDGDAVANLPAKALGGGGSGNGPLPVFHKVLPLLFRNGKLRINLAPVIDVHGELGKEISLILIYAAEPVGKGDFFDAGNALDLVRVGERQRLDDRGAINDDQAVGAGNINASAERNPHDRQNSKQEQRHRERSNGEDEADFFAKQIRANQPQKFHRAPPLETTCRRSASTSTPFSRCSVVLARAATTGSCVTIKTVFLYSFTRRRIS